MIAVSLLGSICRLISYKGGRYLSSFWYPRQYLLPIGFLICLGIFILIVIIIALLFREFNRESTKRCPYCHERIPTDAVWCKFCKRDLTEHFGQLNNLSDFERPGRPCPECDHDMQFIPEQKRWFCPYCKEYK